MPNFPDEEDLTFRDLFRCTREGILLCEVLVQLQSGLVAPHYTVADMWRRILFLGAGEMHEEWVAGIMGVTADDMRCDIIEGVRQPRLDARLRDDLRVLQLDMTANSGLDPEGHQEEIFLLASAMQAHAAFL